MSKNVKIFKDVTGQEVIAELVEKKDIKSKSEWVFKNPMSLVPTERGLVPLKYMWSLPEDGKITIKEQFMLVQPIPADDAQVEQYNKLFSKIETVDSTLVFPNS